MKWRTNKLLDLRNGYAEELYPIYGKEESDAMLSLLIKRYFNLTRTDMIVDPSLRLSESEILRLHFAVKDLKKHRPIQYILKHVDFLNTRILVNEYVLIPRPETEELVRLIIEKEKSNREINILDIGTGSGCIAIALAKNFNNAVVSGIDLSADAIQTAKKNAFINEVMVHFSEVNILEPDDYDGLGEFDVIISNPPYVTQADKMLMNKNVLDYEPHQALFVTDEDPLLFYKAILYFSGEKLLEGGRIYFEINEKYGSEVVDLLSKNGFDKVTLHHDIFDKDRFVSARKKSNL